MLINLDDYSTSVQIVLYYITIIRKILHQSSWWVISTLDYLFNYDIIYSRMTNKLQGRLGMTTGQLNN
jgi:hypothetical protein